MIAFGVLGFSYAAPGLFGYAGLAATLPPGQPIGLIATNFLMMLGAS